MHRSRLAALAFFSLPALALAHPGHSAFDFSQTPHPGHEAETLIFALALVVALAAGGVDFLRRL